MFGSFLIDMGLLIGQNTVDIPVKIMLVAVGFHYVICDQLLNTHNIYHYVYAIGLTYTFMFVVGKYFIFKLDKPRYLGNLSKKEFKIFFEEVWPISLGVLADEATYEITAIIVGLL